jgi:hypothetical protein
MCTFFVSGPAGATESLADRIKSLEPIISAFPPNIKNEEELNSVKKKYLDIKSELDSLLAKQPKNQDLLFMRGHLQSMGHNFDYPDAWKGATDDLSTILKVQPKNIPALLELARLWVNSNPNFAQKAELLFRSAQCYNGRQPLEEAQQGIFFALYYQGKVKEAFKQSAYLVKTWPQNEKYLKLKEMTRTVLERKNKDSDIKEPDLGKLVMAGCR